MTLFIMCATHYLSSQWWTSPLSPTQSATSRNLFVHASPKCLLWLHYTWSDRVQNICQVSQPRASDCSSWRPVVSSQCNVCLMCHLREQLWVKLFYFWTWYSSRWIASVNVDRLNQTRFCAVNKGKAHPESHRWTSSKRKLLFLPSLNFPKCINTAFLCGVIVRSTTQYAGPSRGVLFCRCSWRVRPRQTRTWTHGPPVQQPVSRSTKIRWVVKHSLFSWQLLKYSAHLLE